MTGRSRALFFDDPETQNWPVKPIDFPGSSLTLTSVTKFAQAAIYGTRSHLGEKKPCATPASRLRQLWHLLSARQQDMPISITALNRDTILKRNIVSTADLGPYVPSVSGGRFVLHDERDQP